MQLTHARRALSALGLALALTGMTCSHPGIEVVITSPAPGTTFRTEGDVTITVSVESDESVDGVQFFVGGNANSICDDDRAPYTCTWSITKADNGPHTLIANAYAYVNGKASIVGAATVDVTVAIDESGLGVPSGDPRLTGFVPAVGTAVAVAVDEARDLAFVSSREFGLSVVDVSDPLDAVTIGATNPPFQGYRVAIDDSLAVVTNDDSLKVVDISNPHDPVPIGSLSTTAPKDVDLVGQHAYALLAVPGNPGHVDLVVVDVGQPESPVERGRVTVPGWGEAVEVIGGRAYVAAGGSGLQVFDVTNPLSPSRIGGVDTPGGAVAVTVSGSYAYIGEWNAVHAIDIANPANPILRGQVGVRGRDLAISGGRLFAGGGNGVSVLSLANPAYPSLIVTDPDFPSLGLDAAGDTIYMAFGGFPDTGREWGGLFILDASGPSELGLLDTAYGLTEVGSVAVDGNTALVSGGDRLKVVDVSNPRLPEVLGSLDTASINDVALEGRVGYMLVVVPGNPAHVDLVVVDLAQPDNPVLRGQLTVPGWGTRVEVHGNRAYVAAGAEGLQVFDVSNPFSPRRIGGVDTPGAAVALELFGDYAYLGERDAVHVIDIRNPSNPIRRGQVDVPATDVNLVGSILCASSASGLRTIDVTNPNDPRLVGTNSSATGHSSSVAGGLVFVAEWFNDGGPQPRGVAHVVDISNPADPELLLTEIIMPGATGSSATDGARVYFQDTVGTVSVIEP